jgi:hypothetical protein
MCFSLYFRSEKGNSYHFTSLLRDGMGEPWHFWTDTCQGVRGDEKRLPGAFSALDSATVMEAKI